MISCTCVPHCLCGVLQGSWQSLPFWRCSAQGLGPLIQTDGKFKSEVYLNVIRCHLLPCALGSHFQTDVFSFSTATVLLHMSAILKTRLESLELPQIEWPAHGSDRNLIENVQDITKYQVSASRQPLRTRQALWEAVEQQWNALKHDCDAVTHLHAFLHWKIRVVVRPTEHQRVKCTMCHNASNTFVFFFFQTQSKRPKYFLYLHS